MLCTASTFRVNIFRIKPDCFVASLIAMTEKLVIASNFAFAFWSHTYAAEQNSVVNLSLDYFATDKLHTPVGVLPKEHFSVEFLRLDGPTFFRWQSQLRIDGKEPLSHPRLNRFPRGQALLDLLST
jgi:hypothetical protein